MDKRFHKRAISAAAAVMTLTTVVTSVDAAQKNEITIDSTQSAVKAGDSFGLTVGYTPDSLGAAGFTIDLHYDADAVTLVLPDENTYYPDSSFSIVTNFEYDEGTVRIVGVEPDGENVKKNTLLADLEFVVKDGYSGQLGFWTEVEDLVAADGGDLVNVDFKAFGEYTQYTMTAKAPAAETSYTTTTAAQAKPAETTTTVTTTASETQTSLPEQVIPPADTLIPETQQTTKTETSTAVPDTPQTTSAPADTQTDLPEDDENNDTDEIFSHKQGKKDFNSEEPLQYIFSPYDYTEVSDQTVDIAVTVEADGNVSGGIGMLTKDGWKCFNSFADGSGETVWTAKNIDLSEVESDIAVQVYYIEHDSVFSIKDIKVTSVNSAAEETETQQNEADENNAAAETAVTTQEPVVTQTDIPVQQPPLPETTAPQTQPEPEQTTSETESSSKNNDVQSSESQEDKDSDEKDTESKAAETTGAQSSSDTDIKETTSSKQSAEEISASESGGSSTVTTSGSASSVTPSDSNPGTGFLGGNGIPAGIIALCLAQIGYSAYKLTRKDDDSDQKL